MALTSKGPTIHNSMDGKKITLQSPTTFLDNHSIFPPSKRVKRFDSMDGEANIESSKDASISHNSQDYQAKIASSGVDSEEDVLSAPKFPTDLECALPAIETNQQAIDQYEAMRAAGNIPEDLRSCLHQKRWTKGQSSIYVDAFNLALETVLEEESHLFDEKEMEVFRHWRDLEYESQYLYVRLFLRKTSAWHRLSRLGYHSDISDLANAVRILQYTRALPKPSPQSQVTSLELKPPDGTTLKESFRFAESSDEMINTFEEASSLLTLDELKAFAKEAKVQGKNKSELLRSFRSMSRRQSGLGWVGLTRSDSEQTATSKGNSDLDNSIFECNRDTHFLKKILANIGTCIRISLPPLKLFERVHLVFYRSTEWTDKSLTTIILARISRRNFPPYIVSRSANIFVSRAELLEFEAALKIQFRVDNILEMNGSPVVTSLEEVLSIFEEIYPRWKILLQQEQHKENRVYQSGEGAYLRRFSPAWVYTRIVHKSLHALGRLKFYEREHAITSELLDQKLFHTPRRGAWYQRKALLEEHYMYIIQPPPGMADVYQQKRHWKRISLGTCESGLQDKDCHLIYHYDLQKRIRKLEKQLKIPMRQQHDFGHASFTKPIEVTIEGVQIKRGYPPNRGKAGSHDEAKPRDTKTIWVDETEGGCECSVEAMCLSSYRSRGYKGYHSEGGIIRTLFGYLFYDVLFMYIPNVFQTPYQTCPLDLYTDAFFPSRASEINHRLVEISNGSAADLIRAVDTQERKNRTCIVGLNWDFELSDLLEIVECFNRQALSTVCKVMAQEYKMRGGGMPDLFLWDAKRKEVLFSEVKSENDRLSDTQRLWIHVLTGAGIKVELCNAVAKEVKFVSTR